MGRSGMIRWGVLLLLLLNIAVSVRHAVWAASCRVSMVEQPIREGVDWHAWPILSGLGGYSVVDLSPYRDLGWTSARPHPPGDARLTGNGVCAERGVSLQSWLGQEFIPVSADDWTVRLREEPRTGTALVTGERTRPGEDRIAPRPIVAFRREPDPWMWLVVRIVAWPLASLIALVAWWRVGVLRE